MAKTVKITIYTGKIKKWSHVKRESSQKRNLSLSLRQILIIEISYNNYECRKRTEYTNKKQVRHGSTVLYNPSILGG